MKKFLSVFLGICLVCTVFTVFPGTLQAETKDPLTVESVIGLTDAVGVFRMALQDGSQFSPLYQTGLLITDDGTLYVADSGESQVEVFTSDLMPKAHFGGIGKEDGKYMYLTSVNMCANGNLYLTDSYLGKVSIVKTDGTFIKSFGNAQGDPMTTPCDVDFLPDGSILVADSSAGVLKYDAQGKYIGLFTTYSGMSPSIEDFYGPTQLEVDKNGNVYVAASSMQGICKVSTFDSKGNFLVDCINVGSDQESIGGLITSLAIEDTTFLLSQINGRSTQVKKFALPTDPKSLLIFKSAVCSSPVSGTIEVKDVVYPSGVALYKDSAYILDGCLSRLMTFDKQNELTQSYMSQVDGQPIFTIGQLYQDESPNGILSNPQGVRVDMDGNVYVGNSNFCNVVIFNEDGEDIQHLGQILRRQSPSAGEFASTTDLCFDQEGFLYVSDTSTNTIHVFDQDFEPWTIIDEGFSSPQGLCVNHEGELVVVNSKSATLSILDISDIYDEYAQEVDSYPIPGVWPVGVSCNADDDMYIAMTGSNTVVAMDPDGDIITQWGETGKEPGQFDAPQGTCVDGEGSIYVADTGGGRIQKFTAEGELVWSSNLQWPGLTFLTMGSDGKLYVTDCLHSVVVVLNDPTAVPPDDGTISESETVFSLKAPADITTNSSFSLAIMAEDIEEITRVEIGLTLPLSHVNFTGITPGKLLGPGTISDPDLLDTTLMFDVRCPGGITGSGVLASLELDALNLGEATFRFDRIRMFDKRDKEVTIKESKPLTIMIKKGDIEPPVIQLEKFPTETYQESILIKGSTEVDALVTINEEELTLDEKGNFSYTAMLKLGANEFVFQATDTAGNTSEKMIEITRMEIIILQFVIGSRTYHLNKEPFLLDAAPFVHVGRTVVPIRPVVEAIQGEILWDSTDRKVTIKKDTTLLELWIDNPKAKLNGVLVSIDESPTVTPMIVSGRTFLPLRFVAENLGFAVGWDGPTQTITLTYPNPEE